MKCPKCKKDLTDTDIVINEQGELNIYCEPCDIVYDLVLKVKNKIVLKKSNKGRN